jgi:hypothetical protein
MSRQECAICKVQTTEFGCKNCGSTRLNPVPMTPVAAGSQRALLEASHASRARSIMLVR